jgi:flagellar hook protein FlgE
LANGADAKKGIIYGASTPKANLSFQYEDLMNDPVYVGTVGDKNVLKWDMASATVDTSGITSYAATSETRAFSLDGWTQGTLKSVSFDADGKITGYFTNGQTKSLGQLQLARFTNPAGLKKVGNYFTRTEISGDATRNYAGSGGVGDIRSNALEISNTDVTTEFINMMTAQRAYQANARVITADDQNFQQLISIKR